MRELDFAITNWLGSAEADPIDHATFASLRINASGIPVTEVEDIIARTVRPDIHVSAYLVAQWLLVNWWRLRWEPRRESREWYGVEEEAIGDAAEYFGVSPLAVQTVLVNKGVLERERLAV